LRNPETWSTVMFRDRREAGCFLADLLAEYGGREDVIVLALPRGGVPVGYEVARKLGAPLDVFVVRKLGAPGQPEFALGAIASGGVRVVNRDAIQALGIADRLVEEIARREQEELSRRERLYRGNRPAPNLTGKTVILVDDGLATGSTMRSAAAAIKQQSPSRLVVAVPVAARSTCDELAQDVDQVVCAVTPFPFFAVGQWYSDFSETSDDEVRDLLERTARELRPAA
jgi:putative phosphoribosyl transferase